MGGSGSGFPIWKTKKIPVEDCLPLSADKLRRDGLLYEPPPGTTVQGSLNWHSSWTKAERGSAGYRIEHGTGGRLWFRLLYRVQDESVDLRILLERVPYPVGGGLRWLFRCPLVVDGQHCLRRCGKLWLPPGARYFGCRTCYQLTYTSSQENHQGEALAAQIAAKLGGGVTPYEVLEQLKQLGEYERMALELCRWRRVPRTHRTA